MTTIKQVKCNVCGYVLQNDYDAGGQVSIKHMVQYACQDYTDVDLCSWECLCKFMEQFRDNMVPKSKKHN